MVQQEWDVIVIGAGPAGATIAALIAQAKFQCLLIEKDVYPSFQKPTAACIPLALCKRLRVGNDIIEKEIYNITFNLPRCTQRWHTKKPLSIIVNRQKFEALLIEYGLKAGVKLLVKTEVTDVKKGPVIFAKNLENNEEFNLKANLVVFANGTSDLAYRTLGIGIKNEPVDTIIIFAYEFECKENLLNEVKIYFDLQNNCLRLYRLYPKKDTVTILVGMLYSEKSSAIEYRYHLDKFIKKALPILSDKKILRINTGFKPMHLAENLFTNSALVIGDATGMVNPLSQDGIAYGIKNAQIAAKICIKALREKKYDRTILSQYLRYLKKTKFWWWLKIWGGIRESLLSLAKSKNTEIAFHLLLVRLYSFVAKILIKIQGV